MSAPKFGTVPVCRFAVLSTGKAAVLELSTGSPGWLAPVPCKVLAAAHGGFEPAFTADRMETGVEAMARFNRYLHGIAWSMTFHREELAVPMGVAADWPPGTANNMALGRRVVTNPEHWHHFREPLSLDMGERFCITAKRGVDGTLPELVMLFYVVPR